MSQTVHWLEDKDRDRKPEHEHINMPRMNAETMLNLVNLKNSLMGTNNSVYEESELSQEKRVY